MGMEWRRGVPGRTIGDGQGGNVWVAICYVRYHTPATIARIRCVLQTEGDANIDTNTTNGVHLRKALYDTVVVPTPLFSEPTLLFHFAHLCGVSYR